MSDYWPTPPNGIPGEPGGWTTLLDSQKVCHRCGQPKPRWIICEGCELIVCDHCRVEEQCLECWRAEKRAAA